MNDRASATMESFMAPVWAGGWGLTRILWCFAALIMVVPRAWGIGDAYGAFDMVLTHPSYNLNSYVFVTPAMAWAAWGLALVGIAFVARGRYLLHAGLLIWFVGNWSLLMNEVMNIKAYDRLFLWISFAMFLSPAWETKLTEKYRSPLGRYALLVVYCAIYGSTGLTKLLHESSWLGDGSALAYGMLDLNHGGSALGAWISGQTWIVAPMSWMTLAFELGFPFLVWFRRVNPWLLLVGFTFHALVMLTFHVGAFFFVATTAYPVLLHPEAARELHWRIRTRAVRRLSTA